MGKHFDLIVFDWDGTLMDSTAAIVRALQAACVDTGVPVPSTENASHVIGLSLAGALEYILPGVDAATLENVADRYRFHFLARDHELALFDGAQGLVERLRADGFLLAVATGKARRGLDRVLGYSGIGHCFHATRCADESFSKPHPGMLLDLLDTLKVAPGRALMIGDTSHDLQMASNAGVAALAVSHGAHPIAVLQAERSLGIVDSIVGMNEWLIRNA